MSAAADWVQADLDALHRQKPRKYPKVELREFQRKAVGILSRGMGTGPWNIRAWEKTDWRSGHGVRFTLIGGGLSTFDSNHLTRLVILAHDECVRIHLVPAARQVFHVYMHPRDREGDLFTRHPTMEQAIEALRNPA